MRIVSLILCIAVGQFAFSNVVFGLTIKDHEMLDEIQVINTLGDYKGEIYVEGQEMESAQPFGFRGEFYNVFHFNPPLATLSFKVEKMKETGKTCENKMEFKVQFDATESPNKMEILQAIKNQIKAQNGQKNVEIKAKVEGKKLVITVQRPGKMPPRPFPAVF